MDRRDAPGRSRGGEPRAQAPGDGRALPGAALVDGLAEAARNAARFDVGEKVERTLPAPLGHINDSWLVTLRGQSAPAFVLQRLNPSVFRDPARVMENIAQVTDHLAAHARAGRTRREPLALVRTTEGDAWLDVEGAGWRMYRYVAGTHAIQFPRSESDAREAAAAFGELTRLLSDYQGPPLHETIPGFHDTPSRLAQFQDAVRRDSAGRATRARAEIDAAIGHADLVRRMPPLLASGEVPVRIAHNDAKLSNVLLDDATNLARCVVDLDTVMPGSLLFDFGDLVRSVTTMTDEDEPDLAKVGVRLPLFAAIADGFVSETRAILTPTERGLLVHAGELITYEQALRFLTDHLESDRYYRVADPDQNLRRARTQLRHLATLVAAHGRLEAIIANRARRTSPTSSAPA